MDFVWIQPVVLLASFGVFSMGTWMIWPNRWNLIAPIQSGFFLVAYLIPLALTDGLHEFQPSNALVRPELINLYTSIMALGAVMYGLGLLAGASLPRFTLAQKRFFSLPGFLESREYVRRRTIAIATAAVLGLYISFLIMGYVPLFAAEPLQAKYFHNQYRPGYLRAVWLYLPCFYAFAIYVPILMLIMWQRPRIRYAFIFALGLIAFVLTLHRGDLGAPLLTGVGLIMVASKMRRPIPAFLVLSAITWCIGAAANYFLALSFNISVARVSPVELTFGNIIAGGAPDISDNLTLLQRFVANPTYTWGRTWLGGLIPNQSAWNPGIWSLTVALQMTRDDAINVAGGGYRVAIPLTGFSFCDWPGLIGFSFLIGLQAGYVVRFAREVTSKNVSTEVKAVVVVVATAIIPNLDAPTWHTLLPLLMLVPLIHPLRFRLYHSVTGERLQRASPRMFVLPELF